MRGAAPHTLTLFETNVENAEDSSKKTHATQRTITCLKLHSKYSKKDRFSGHIIRTAFQNVL